MHKFRFFLLILVLCLLLSSCATVEDLPPDMIESLPDTGKEDDTSKNTDPYAKAELQGGEFRGLVASTEMINNKAAAFWNNLIFTSSGKVINVETKEILPACSDPLCDHRGGGCAIRILNFSSCMAISPASSEGNLVLYIVKNNATLSEELTVSNHYQLFRYSFYNGELTVLCENLPGSVSFIQIDPKTENLFFYPYIDPFSLSESQEREHYLYIVNGKTGKLNIFRPDTGISARYAIDDTVYFSASDGGAYCIDFSKKELALEKTEEVLNGDSYGYVYYKENIFTERVYVPDHILPFCEKYEQPTYEEFTGYDLYRINVLKEDAQPELVAQRVLSHGQNGAYVYYKEFSPQYVTSVKYVSYYDERGMKQFGLYFVDDPDAPEGKNMRHEFLSAGAIRVLNAADLELVTTIQSDRYYASFTCENLVGDGVFVSWFSKAPEDYLLTNSDVVRRKSFGYLYFNKPLLTEQDTLEFDLTNTEY